MSRNTLPAPPRAALEALAEKYEALVQLRLARDRDEPHPPREELRRWSQAFPGCLRELDRLPAGELTSRAAALRALLSTAVATPPARALTRALPAELAWIAWIHRYHELVRAELGRKAGPAPDDPANGSAEARARERSPRPSLRALERLARETGVDARQLGDVLFPPRRRG